MTLQEFRVPLPEGHQIVPRSKLCYLTVVIPAKNEEQRLPATIINLSHALKSLGIDYEVIVVNDGSTDKTAYLAQTLGAQVISNSKSLGIAASFRLGAKQSNGEVVMLCPADIEDFSFLKLALSASRAYDVVSISKRHPQSVVIGYDKWRWFLSNNYQKIIDLLFGKLDGSSDTHYIKLYDSMMLRWIADRCIINGPVGETEIMLRARNLGCTCYEIPATIKHNSAHSKTSFKMIGKTTLELLHLWLRKP